jgi:hypothetical protein
MVALAVLLVGALASCGGGGGGNSGGDDAGFDVSLEMRGTNGSVHSSFGFGMSMVFAITITNLSGGTQVLTLPSSQTYDLAVLPEGSAAPRWRWSFNRTFTPASSEQTFAPHQSLTYLYIWNGVLEDGTQIMPGTYDFRGTLAYPGYASDWRSNDELASPIRKITITD